MSGPSERSGDIPDLNVILGRCRPGVLKLLVDHRDDLVDERRRCRQRLRWHLQELDPALHVSLGALDRSVWLDRLGRQLTRRAQTTQVRIARDLLGRCRTLSRSIGDLDRELRPPRRRRTLRR